MRTFHQPWFAVIAPAVAGFAFAALSVLGFETYGWSLFLGLPLVVSFLSAFCTSFRRTVSFSRAYWLSVGSLLLVGALILLFALDGLICLLMALPLAMLLALIGAALGRAAGRAWGRGVRSVTPLVVLIAFPGLVAFDSERSAEPAVRIVTTTVAVAAPIERVWDLVVAFPPISEPPQGVFRFGISYPVAARIEGDGAGAVRYCTFSTGSFEEPITRWERPALLAFDVTSSPPPMKEFSFHEHVAAPHLHGHMVSRRGQFRLVERDDGKVVLEGATWYSHSLSPQWYWGPISDQIIHQIHGRVLNHIRRLAESPDEPLRPQKGPRAAAAGRGRAPREVVGRGRHPDSPR